MSGVREMHSPVCGGTCDYSGRATLSASKGRRKELRSGGRLRFARQYRDGDLPLNITRHRKDFNYNSICPISVFPHREGHQLGVHSGLTYPHTRTALTHCQSSSLS